MTRPNLLFGLGFFGVDLCFLCAISHVFCILETTLVWTICPGFGRIRKKESAPFGEKYK